MYVRQVDNQKLTFCVSGKLWNRSLIMGDVETRTEWSHLLGKAMAGPLEGKELKPLISDMVTWKRWREKHPETTVLDLPRTARNYTGNFYQDKSRFLLGFIVQGEAYSIGMDAISESPVHSFEIENRPFVATYDAEGEAIYLFSRKLDGRVLTFHAGEKAGTMIDRETGSTWSSSRGVALSGELQGKLLEAEVGIMSFEVAWRNFHPESTAIEIDQPR